MELNELVVVVVVVDSTLGGECNQSGRCLASCGPSSSISPVNNSESRTRKV